MILDHYFTKSTVINLIFTNSGVILSITFSFFVKLARQISLKFFIPVDKGLLS